MKHSAASPLAYALVLVVLAGCGGSSAQRAPADLRGDAIRPVDQTPPEGTLVEATPTPERFTLRRTEPIAARVDSVPKPARAVAPPRPAPASDTAVAAPIRTETAAPPPAATTPPSANSDFLVKPVPPEPISRVAPVYPERAREARVGGVVIVKALVGTDGRVRATRIARSIAELDSAAIACVKQWRFKPATSSGVPIASWTDVPVRFLLQ